jgi:DNA-binding winged helix-turn-helix (wHTH) protein/tetratricopeptide (TPR) repeat protein
MKRFHAFRLDTVNHCLWRGEERLSLAPKAFDVLRYLVEHADRLVTQEEILEALWPGTYVNPEVVKKYVLGIRRILGDRTDKPEFVATFPRRGYQFIATVRDETSRVSDVTANAVQPIVGREAALSQLKDALNKVSQGQRQIVFITGEAGIGKTTLVDVFNQSAAFGANVRVARGHCLEGFGGKESYYPIMEALGQLLRHPDGEPIVQAFVDRAPTWLIQFPSLVKADQREALEREILGATRQRMVREICEALETITAQNPLVLILEDLHWADPSTLDFISALARRRGPSKLLLLATYRPADVIISRSPLKALKQDLIVHNLCHEISLERLEESDVAEYLAIQFADGNFPSALANLIYRHSGGNALFMVTIVQDMVKKGLLAEASGKWELTTRLEEVEPNVPETLQQLIEVQFERLGSAEQGILRSASVAGDRFSVWALTTAVSIEPGGIEAACEALAERQQFIKAVGIHELANGEVSAHYEFRHSLYREVLYRRLSNVARSKLHHLLGQRLEPLCIPCELELATELAAHFEGGHDYEQAVRYLIVAAENAARRLAHRDSIEILRHAHELVAKPSSKVTAELEIQILDSLGDAHFALGAMAASSEAYAVAASRAADAGLKTVQVLSLTCAMNPLGFIDPAKGIAALEQAVEVGMCVDDPALLARTQMLAAAYRLVFDTWRQEDADLCASTHETLLRLGDTDTRSYQRMIYAHVLALQGNYRESLETFEAGISRVDNDISMIARYIAFLGKTLVLMQTGRLGDVVRIARAEKKLAEKNGSAPWLFEFREAWARTLALDYAGARKICGAINESGTNFITPQLMTIDRIAAGCIELDRQEYNQAIQHFQEVREDDLTPKFLLHWIFRMKAQLETANAWLLSGDISKALAEADGFFEAAMSTADPNPQALAWDLKARVAMAEKNWAGARESIQQALAIVDKFEILVAAWQVHATAWQLYCQAKEIKLADSNRKRAETCILRIANSFAPDEPLRASFLSAPQIARVLATSAPQPAPKARRART